MYFEEHLLLIIPNITSVYGSFLFFYKYINKKGLFI